MGMWISAKRWRTLEEKIAELEHGAQIQRDALDKHLSDHEQENKKIRNILTDIKKELYKGTAQIL